MSVHIKNNKIYLNLICNSIHEEINKIPNIRKIIMWC